MPYKERKAIEVVVRQEAERVRFHCDNEISWILHSAHLHRYTLIYFMIILLRSYGLRIVPDSANTLLVTYLRQWVSPS